MEVVKNEATGKFRVLLGGQVLTGCSVDVDCPGRAFCTVNATWSEFPKSSLGNAVMAVYIVVAIIGLIGALWAGLNVYRLIRSRQSTRDALFTSTFLLFIASFCLTLFGGLMCGQPIRQFIPDEEGSKKTDLSWKTGVLAATLFSSTLACMNITLVWVQIADNVRRMKTKTTSNVARHYQIALLVFYVIILGGIIATMRSENASRGAAAVAALTMGFVLLSYIFGFIKMNFMLTTLVSSSGSDEQQATNIHSSASSKGSLRIALRKIRIVSFFAGICTLTMLILSILYTLNEAEDCAPDRATTSAMENAFSWICLGGVLHVNIWYISGTVSKKYAIFLNGPASGTSKDDAHNDTNRSTKKGESSTSPHAIVSSQVGSIVPGAL